MDKVVIFFNSSFKNVNQIFEVYTWREQNRKKYKASLIKQQRVYFKKFKDTIYRFLYRENSTDNYVIFPYFCIENSLSI